MGLNKSNSIISYAVLSAKFEANDGGNIILTLIPLVEYLLISIHEKTFTTGGLSNAFEDMYGYKIPLAVIDELLKVLDRKKKIEKLKNEEYLIILENIEEYDEIENYNKKLRNLVMDIVYFFKKRGMNVSQNEVTNELMAFIIQNALSFNDFILHNSNFEDVNVDNASLHDNLIEFLIEERKNETPNYKFLNEIYYGAVVANIITNWEETGEETANAECSIENVLVDSNFVFRLLDLQTKTEHLVANDTYEILKNNGCKFWIYEDTIQQISDTLHNVANKYNATTNKVLASFDENEYGGVLSACMRRNLTPAKIEGIITNLEKEIRDRGINLFEEFRVTESEIDKDDISDLYKIKQKSHESIVHDLILVEIIKRKRTKAIYQMKQAKWWLLTDDIKLTKWNSGKRTSHGVPQCITESQVATVLWLNKPKNIDVCGLFPTVVALRNRNLVDNDEYEKITRNIEQLSKRCDDERSQKKLALIFSLKLLSLDDLIDTTEDGLDPLLQQKMVESDKYIAQLESEKEEISEKNQHNEKLSQQYKEQVNIVTLSSQKYKSLYDEEREKYIESLRKLRDTKIKQVDEKKESLLIIKRKINTQIRICRVIAVLLIFLGMFLVIKIAPRYQNWFSQNELMYSGLGVMISLLLSALGLKCDFHIMLNKLFIKIKLQKDYIGEIETIENIIKELEDEINDIQKQLNEKIDIQLV